MQLRGSASKDRWRPMGVYDEDSLGGWDPKDYLPSITCMFGCQLKWPSGLAWGHGLHGASRSYMQHGPCP